MKVGPEPGILLQRECFTLQDWHVLCHQQVNHSQCRVINWQVKRLLVERSLMSIQQSCLKNKEAHHCISIIWKVNGEKILLLLFCTLLEHKDILVHFSLFIFKTTSFNLFMHWMFALSPVSMILSVIIYSMYYANNVRGTAWVLLRADNCSVQQWDH